MKIILLSLLILVSCSTEPTTQPQPEVKQCLGLFSEAQYKAKSDSIFYMYKNGMPYKWYVKEIDSIPKVGSRCLVTFDLVNGYCYLHR